MTAHFAPLVDTDDGTLRPTTDRPFFRWETITPEQARRLLGYNTRNRNPKAQSIAALARDMLAGEFDSYTAEPIKFSGTPEDPGVLLDGQNRLHAVIRAGVAIALLVAYNIPERAQMVMDSGVSRSMGDVLRMQGVSNASALAAALSYLILYPNVLDKTRKVTKPEKLALWDRIGEDLRGVIHDAERFRRAVRFGSRGCAIATMYLIHDADPEEAGSFIADAIEGVDLQPGDPVLALRDRLLSENGTRVRPEARMALTIKAFNAYRAGDRVSQLRWKPGGSKREPFPIVRPASDYAS
jgi:hypothetical protein